MEETPDEEEENMSSTMRDKDQIVKKDIKPSLGSSPSVTNIGIFSNHQGNPIESPDQITSSTSNNLYKT